MIYSGNNTAGLAVRALGTLTKLDFSNQGEEIHDVSTLVSDWGGRLEFDCSNIQQINISRKLGHGAFKTGLLGVYRGRKVVLKMVRKRSRELKKCLSEHLNMPKRETRCRLFVTMYFMNEILLLHQINHPNFVDLLGFCVRGNDINSMSLEEHGVIAVYEYGDKVNVTDMELWPLSRRLDTAIQLLDLAIYAEHSPLGSLRLEDMKHANFRVVGSRIKFSDVDSVTAGEPPCLSVTDESGCSLHLPCVENRCRGFNAKFNLMKINKLFLKKLLRSSTVEDKGNTSSVTTEVVNEKLHSVRSELKALGVTASSNSTDIYWKLINIKNMLEI